MQIWRLNIPIAPQGKGRPRVVRNYGQTQVYTPDATANAEKVIQVEALRAGVRPLDGPVAVEIIVRHRAPKSLNRVQRGKALNGDLLPTRKPDLDNVAKLVLDSLNGRAWADDAQVTSLKINRLYAEEDGLTIAISSL